MYRLGFSGHATLIGSVMRSDIRRMIETGNTATLEKESDAVPVTLMYTPRLQNRSRVERREILRQEFKHISAVTGDNCKLEFDSISPSGQTIKGIVAIDRFDEVEKVLAQQGVRIDLEKPYELLE